MAHSAMPIDLRRSFDEDWPHTPPRTASFNIVARCNAGCAYCADWRNDPDPRTDVPLALILETLDQLAGLGVPRVVFSGGEPFLRMDFQRIVDRAASLGLGFGVITNGTAATERRLAAVCALGPEFMSVSIDSLDAERTRRIRGLPVARVLATIDTLVGIRARSSTPFRITLQTTITRWNIDDLLPLAEFARERGLAMSLQPVHHAGTDLGGSIRAGLWPSEPEIVRLESVLATLVSMRAEGCLVNNRDDYLAEIPRFLRDRTYYPDEGCPVAYTDVVIDTRLGVRPCWSMEPVDVITEQRGIRDIWFGEPMRAARRAIRRRECPGCLYRCHLDKPYFRLGAGTTAPAAQP